MELNNKNQSIDEIEKVDPATIIDNIRLKSSGFMNARVEYAGIKEVNSNLLAREELDKRMPVCRFTQCHEALRKLLGGNFRYLTRDRFVLDYDMRCNINGKGHYGVSCYSMSFSVGWDLHPVEVKTFRSRGKSVTLNTDLQGMLQVGKIYDYNKFAASSGFSGRDLKDQSKDMLYKIMDVFNVCSSAQNKLTRLVKGCCIYLDLLETGSFRCEAFHPDSVDYGVENLAAEYQVGRTAYVFAHSNTSQANLVMLYAMCQEYPNPSMGGLEHISIPADDLYIKVVTYGRLSSNKRATLTAPIAWGTLVSYASEMGILDVLNEALVIACSLRENRYLSTVNLPAVLSLSDLIAPALADARPESVERVEIDTAAAKQMGRVHQMMCGLLIKDMHTSAVNTSQMIEGVGRTIRSMISQNSAIFPAYMDSIAQAPILDMTPSFYFLNSLTDEDLMRVNEFSAFEGLWLVCYPKMVLRDGLVKCLKKGNKQPIGMHQIGIRFDTYCTLYEEVRKGGHELTFTPADGEYNIRFSCMRGKVEPVRDLDFGENKCILLDIVSDMYIPCPTESNDAANVAEGWELESDDGEDIAPDDMELTKEGRIIGTQHSFHRINSSEGGDSLGWEKSFSNDNVGRTQSGIRIEEVDVPQPNDSTQQATLASSTGGQGPPPKDSTLQATPVSSTGGQGSGEAFRCTPNQPDENVGTAVPNDASQAEGDNGAIGTAPTNQDNGEDIASDNSQFPPLVSKAKKFWESFTRPSPQSASKSVLVGNVQSNTSSKSKTSRGRTIPPSSIFNLDPLEDANRFKLLGKLNDGVPQPNSAVEYKANGDPKNREGTPFQHGDMMVDKPDFVFSDYLGFTVDFLVNSSYPKDLGTLVLKSFFTTCDGGWYDNKVANVLKDEKKLAIIKSNSTYCHLYSLCTEANFTDSTKELMMLVVNMAKYKRKVTPYTEVEKVKFSKCLSIPTKEGEICILNKGEFKPSNDFRIKLLDPHYSVVKYQFWFRELCAKRCFGSNVNGLNIGDNTIDILLNYVKSGGDELKFSYLYKMIGGNLQHKPIWNLNWSKVEDRGKEIFTKFSEIKNRRKGIKSPWWYDRRKNSDAYIGTTQDIEKGKIPLKADIFNESVNLVASYGNKSIIFVAVLLTCGLELVQPEMFCAVIKLLKLHEDDYNASLEKLDAYGLDSVRHA